MRQAPLLRGFVAYDRSRERWLLMLLSHHLAMDHATLEMMFGGDPSVSCWVEADRLPAPVPFRTFVAQARLGISREEHEAFFREMLWD